MAWNVNKVMCRACEIGKIVVNRCISRGYSINTQKLQKLLVLMQGEYIVCKENENYEPLFEETIRLSASGFVIDEVDIQFKPYAVSFSEPLDEYITLVDAKSKVVDLVLDRYGKANTIEINNDPRLLNLKKQYELLGKICVSTEDIKKEFLQYGFS